MVMGRWTTTTALLLLGAHWCIRSSGTRCRRTFRARASSTVAAPCFGGAGPWRGGGDVGADPGRHRSQQDDGGGGGGGTAAEAEEGEDDDGKKEEGEEAEAAAEAPLWPQGWHATLAEKCEALASPWLAVAIFPLSDDDATATSTVITTSAAATTSSSEEEAPIPLPLPQFTGDLPHSCLPTHRLVIGRSSVASPALHGCSDDGATAPVDSRRLALQLTPINAGAVVDDDDKDEDDDDEKGALWPSRCFVEIVYARGAVRRTLGLLRLPRMLLRKVPLGRGGGGDERKESRSGKGRRRQR